jgi:hypothetical protein
MIMIDYTPMLAIKLIRVTIQGHVERTRYSGRNPIRGIKTPPINGISNSFLASLPLLPNRPTIKEVYKGVRSTVSSTRS